MNIPTNFWKTATGLLGIGIALAAVILVKEIKSVGYVGANPTQTNTITVDGTGDAFAAPDVATFSFTVTETGKTVAAAQAAATAKNNAALSALKSGGVADKDVQTASYDINPHYENQTGPCSYGAYNGASAGSSSGLSGGAMIQSMPVCPPSKQVLTGYDVSQTTTVKVRDLSKAGDLFTAIGGLGVESVYGFQFSIDNPDSIQAQARSKAIADAQSRAGELAKELGVSLVRVASFTEDSGAAPMPYRMNAMSVGAAAPESAPDVSAGQQKVTDNVEITYEIE